MNRMLFILIVALSVVKSDAQIHTGSAIMQGKTNKGDTRNLNATSEGHLEVAIHSPAAPFGSLAVDQLVPVFQSDAIYQLNPHDTITNLTITGSATVANQMFNVVSGSGTIGSSATIQSRPRLRYRPGQGVVGRYTALFTTGIDNNIQLAGFGTAESGFYFGYNGTEFGVLHVTDGTREIHTMTITTASTATNVYVVTPPGGTAVNVTATANSSTAQTAREIAAGSYPGWQAEARGSTVIFLSGSASPIAGTFSLAQTGAGTPAAGSDVETLAGVTATSTWVAQSSWNGDVCDGTGASGFTLDPTKGNLFEIGVQYLGFGSVTMRVEATYDNSNNSDWITVHTFKFPNSRTTPHVKQPSFPFTMTSYNTGTASGSTTVSVGSFAGMIAGQKVLNGPRISYNSGLAPVTSSTSAYIPLFSIRNDLVYNGRPNQSVIVMLSVGGAAKSNTGLTTFYLIKNAVLSGPTSWAQYDSRSPSYYDSTSTACTFSDGDLLWVQSLAESDSRSFAFTDGGILLQPGETATLAVRSVTATATTVGSLNTREDQ